MCNQLQKLVLTATPFKTYMVCPPTNYYQILKPRAVYAALELAYSQAMNSREASEKIRVFASQIPETDRPKFIESVETELMALHEGNFARYWIRPSEFKQWRMLWNS